NAGSVLYPDIISLPVNGKWLYDQVITVEYFRQMKAIGIVGNFQRFCMARLGQFIVARLITVAVGITGLGVQHAWYAVEIRLHTPEAAASQVNHLFIRRMTSSLQKLIIL